MGYHKKLPCSIGGHSPAGSRRAIPERYVISSQTSSSALCTNYDCSPLGSETGQIPPAFLGRNTNLFLDHTDGGSRAFFDTDAAALAVIVVDLAPHGALIEMDGEVWAEFVAVGAEGTDAAVETAFRRRDGLTPVKRSLDFSEPF